MLSERLLQRDWVVDIKHVSREANRATDHLAWLGHVAQPGVCFYESAPAGLVSFLRDDYGGVAFLGWLCSFFFCFFCAFIPVYPPKKRER